MESLRPKRSVHSPLRYRDGVDVETAIEDIESPKPKRKRGGPALEKDKVWQEKARQKSSLALLSKMIKSEDVDTTGAITSPLTPPLDDAATLAAPDPPQVPTEDNHEDTANGQMNDEKPHAGNGPPSSQVNLDDYVRKEVYQKLLTTVVEFNRKVDSYINPPPASNQLSYAAATTVLKSGSGKEYPLQTYYYEKACQAFTIKSVVKNLALALLSSGGPSGTYFRSQSENAETLSSDFPVKLKAVTRIALSRKDKYSGTPVLYIMEHGENKQVKNKNNKNINGGEKDEPKSSEMSVEERKYHFSEMLHSKKLKTWASLGFTDHRRS